MMFAFRRLTPRGPYDSASLLDPARGRAAAGIAGLEVVEKRSRVDQPITPPLGGCKTTVVDLHS